eukprot:6152377-Pyramimonas_sp.AAC.1
MLGHLGRSNNLRGTPPKPTGGMEGRDQDTHKPQAVSLAPARLPNAYLAPESVRKRVPPSTMILDQCRRRPDARRPR